MYPDVVEAAGREISAQEVILDGEAIAFNPKTGKFLPFQETVQRKRKYDIESFAKDVPLKYIVFDALFLDGESLIDQTYVKRRAVVEKLIVGNQTIVPAEMKIVEDEGDLERLFESTLKKGLEGIMAKRLDGVYQAGARGWNWIKLKGSYREKLADTVDAVVMGIDFGQGARTKFGVGSFLVGIYDQKTDSFKTVSKIGTGLTDDEWRELKVQSQKLKVAEKPSRYEVNKLMDCDVWLKPKLVGEFRADELTKSPMHTAGYALRFPRLVKWREKNPEDTTSLKEIEALVKLQKK
jgi:DNA ligase-1